MIIAIDGPAASGKGTIARALGRHFGLPHLDSGKLYRAVALAMLRAGRDPGDAAAATTAAQALDTTLLDAPELTLDTTAVAASIVSAHPGVRAALVARQRAFADQPGGAVIDGRDIGTVIAPHANAKLFVTASPRAHNGLPEGDPELRKHRLDFPAAQPGARVFARAAKPHLLELAAAPDLASLAVEGLDIKSLPLE